MKNVTVRLQDGEDFESLVRRFKRGVKKSGILEECKKRECFYPKSLKRKMKAAEALKRTKMSKKRF